LLTVRRFTPHGSRASTEIAIPGLVQVDPGSESWKGSQGSRQQQQVKGKIKMRIHVVSLGSLALLLGVASSAWAVPTDYAYGNFNGANFDFVTVNETVQCENLIGPTCNTGGAAQFQTPIVVGDQLLFSPTSFDASAAGVTATIVQTHSTISTGIASTVPGAYVDQILITEGGDINLSAFPPGGGTGATGVIASLGGTVLITGALNVSYIGQIIDFGGAGTDFEAVFTPGPVLNQLYVGLQPAGQFGWSGSVLIDIASLFPGVTSVQLVYNNILQANAESGTSSSIQKKAISGPSITVIPEPGTAVLLFGGLLVLAISNSRNRRA
jgi:hypothetical protein